MAGGIELDEDRAFQRRFWRAERIAWLFFALVIVLALAGFTGSGGWFAERSVVMSSGRLHYPAVGRWQTPDTFKFAVETEERLVVELDHAFLDLYEIRQLSPEPEATTPTASGISLDYRPAAGSVIRWDVVPREASIGRRLGVRVNGTPLHLRPLVLP